MTATELTAEHRGRAWIDRYGRVWSSPAAIVGGAWMVTTTTSEYCAVQNGQPGREYGPYVEADPGLADASWMQP